jgi:putative hydrolase of HD superfamily
MDDDALDGLYRFVEAAGGLKDTLRSGWTAAGRAESVAEHSWRLALLAMALAPRQPELDGLEVLKLCLVHDLGEALSGDVPATAQGNDPDRAARERRDLETLAAPAPAELRDELVRLYDDYTGARTPEARFVKALDKLETLITHAQGANPDDFDYAFNLAYGRGATDAVPPVAALRRLADARTRARAGEA